MPGQTKYSNEEIMFVLKGWVRNIKDDKVAIKYQASFGDPSMTEQRAKYVKNKYFKSAKFGNPYDKYKDNKRPEEYEQWLRDNPPCDFVEDSVGINFHKHYVVSPSGVARLRTGESSTSQPQQQAGGIPMTRAQAHKARIPPPPRPNFSSAMPGSSSTATLMAPALSVAGGGMPGQQAPGTVTAGTVDCVLSGTIYPPGQLPLPEMAQPSSSFMADTLDTNIFQNSFYDQNLFFTAIDSTPATRGLAPEAPMEFLDLPHEPVEDQGFYPWDPMFGDNWNLEELDLSFLDTENPGSDGVYAPGEGLYEQNMGDESPTLRKSTRDGALVPEARAAGGREALCVDPALTSVAAEVPEPQVEESSPSFLEQLYEGDVPDFLGGEGNLLGDDFGGDIGYGADPVQAQSFYVGVGDCIVRPSGWNG